MLYKSQILSQASGALGGFVASRNRGGSYMRQRAIPVNPRTNLQHAVRVYLGTLAQFWSQRLTTAQRDGWVLYGKNVPLVNRLGDAKQQSGISAYIRANTPRLQAGLTLIDTPPAIFTLGVTPTLTVQLTGTAGTRAIEYNVGNPDQYAAVDNILIYIGRPQGLGIEYFTGPYRLIAAYDSGDLPAIVLPVDAPYPTQNDHRIFVRATASMADGRYSTYGYASIDLTGFPAAAMAARVATASVAVPGAAPKPATEKRRRRS